MNLGAHDRVISDGKAKRFLRFFDERFGDGAFDHVLDVLADQAGALLRGEAFLREEGDDGFRGGEHDVFFFEALLEAVEFERNDGGDILFLEGVHDENMVEAGKEFRTELFLEFLEDLALDGLEVVLEVGGMEVLAEADAGGLGEGGGTDVRGEDDERVLEAHFSSFGIGQYAFVQYLKEDIEDVRMGLFDLVEKDDRVGAPTDLFGEFAAFAVADVAGRGTDDLGDGVTFHELAHVETNESVLVAEIFLG